MSRLSSRARPGHLTRVTLERRLRRLAGLICGLLLCTVLAGCGSSDAGPAGAGSSKATGAAGSPGSASAGADLSGTLTVFAAASLTTTFTDLAKEFETDHPGSKIRLSFAGSSDLVTQISEGAPADVFASADNANMSKLETASLLAAGPTNFASNVLTIAVPPDNPADIGSFKDLGRSGVKVVVCAPQVPCGAAAAKVEQVTGTEVKPVSEESSVTDVLGKVSSGEADAGLVYVTDAKGAGNKVTAIDFPEAATAVNTYPIATVAGSTHKELAAAFIALVTGPAGQRVLLAAGFGKP
ncbi:molybdate ABC transporter substrate-binding protein [Paeniglutamicibacter antarcticus]|uniref:Molybdate ABC transporter substrate-binding protein n=1 Tax=Arthrobacter terrae TaxID=2935737 RepID=A0A931CLT2_9MICC|nr:molybdate ABC transporter substrate-binding protein [Arthrobacter terrae]MBG0739292.1 molybdate ABC transporter substrate-binding protein [Arthrobacter terrae]